MGWRETLGEAKQKPESYTQKPHNTQNYPKPDNPEEISSHLLEILALATKGLSITPVEVRDELAPEDIKGWEDGEITSDNLAAFARSLEQHREMAENRVPTHYDQVAKCKRCGPVWSWFSGEVAACP